MVSIFEVTMKKIIYSLIALALLFSCSSTQVEKVSQQKTTTVDLTGNQAAPGAVSRDSVDLGEPYVRIYFDYDEDNLREDMLSNLLAISKLMKENSSYTLLVEGHADERGTREYNLALGERRANAAKDYLMTYGISGNRISVISYGKERPVDSGSNPLAWSKNRRSVSVKAN